MYSLGCIIYELFNLSRYYNDNLIHEIKKIDCYIYNKKWQEIIYSLLQKDYNKRMNINQVYDIILNDIKNEMNNININNKNNYKNIIIGEIYINEYNINKDIRIINSFENCKREGKIVGESEYYTQFENEKEIKENTIIKINGKIIEFTYYYKFPEKGKYIIEYVFKKNLTKTNRMFDGCGLLTNLDFSNFNTQYVTDMSNMFSCCGSLTKLDLSNFNTENVTNMELMFFGCNSLTNLNLSNFNTKNVTHMSSMFSCCESLTNLDLSNFNTQNVNYMGFMFNDCKSLRYLNLSNFTTQNVPDIKYMFSDCKSLKKKNIITKDKKILNYFNKCLII